MNKQTNKNVISITKKPKVPGKPIAKHFHGTPCLLQKATKKKTRETNSSSLPLLASIQMNISKYEVLVMDKVKISNINIM